MASVRTIFKYPFEVPNEVEILMQQGAQIVHVECQGDQPCIWAIVDMTDGPGTPMVLRKFVVRGTGHRIRNGLTYIATFQQGTFVWHLFEE